MLEEEVAGRRSFWRRANQIEEDITTLESIIHKRIVRQCMKIFQPNDKTRLSSLIGLLSQAVDREEKRRQENTSELTNNLPVHVLNMLMMVDAWEKEENKSLLALVRKFYEVANKLDSRVATEDEKYGAKIGDMQVSKCKLYL